MKAFWARGDEDLLRYIKQPTPLDFFRRIRPPDGIETSVYDGPDGPRVDIRTPHRALVFRVQLPPSGADPDAWCAVEFDRLRDWLRFLRHTDCAPHL